MSNVQLETESTAAETPPGAPSTTSPARPPKSQRVLACVLCQQRKVKCNRTFPCTNCVKAGAKCVPAAVVRRPRKRRFPERELLDRLRQYEDLLRQNNVSFQPLHKDTDRDNESSKHEDYSDDDHPKAAKSNESSPSAAAKPEMVEAKEFWHTLKQVFRDQYNENDISHEVVREPGALEAWNGAFETSDHFLLGSSKTKLDLSIVHPDPAQIFKLWQVYMDNVDPLLKATHNPSLQARFVEATGNIAIIDDNLEALMFSIYCVSVQSLEAEDCWALFGWSKEDLLSRYQFGCRQALSNSSFLQTDNRECLTALYLYLVSVGRRTHPRALSSILGSAIRIAQRMGIDREAECVKLPPFEAEMSRRLWWSLMLFDSRVSVLAGHKSSTLSPTWDCRVPLNLNDSDIRPGIKEIPRLQSTTTEALFAVARSEVGDFIRRTTFHLNFTSPILKPLISNVQPLPERDALIAFEKSIEKRYFDFCDQENPLHFMTIWTVRAQLAKSRLIEHHSMFSDPSVQQTDAQYDIAISHAFNMLECDTKLFTSSLTKGCLWFLDFHFPFMAYVHIVQDLKRRPVSNHVQRAWDIMSNNYNARFPVTGGWETSLFAFFSVFTKTILRTWEDQEAELKKRKVSMETPRIISSIRLGATKASANTLGSIPQQSSGDMDLDVSNFPLPIGVGLGDFDVLYDVNEQDCYNSGITGSYPGITEGARADCGLDQVNWTSMGWGLDER